MRIEPPRCRMYNPGRDVRALSAMTPWIISFSHASTRAASECDSRRSNCAIPSGSSGPWRSPTRWLRRGRCGARCSAWPTRRWCPSKDSPCGSGDVSWRGPPSRRSCCWRRTISTSASATPIAIAALRVKTPLASRSTRQGDQCWIWRERRRRVAATATGKISWRLRGESPRENFDSSPPRGWSSTSMERRIRWSWNRVVHRDRSRPCCRRRLAAPGEPLDQRPSTTRGAACLPAWWTPPSLRCASRRGSCSCPLTRLIAPVESYLAVSCWSSPTTWARHACALPETGAYFPSPHRRPIGEADSGESKTTTTTMTKAANGPGPPRPRSTSDSSFAFRARKRRSEANTGPKWEWNRDSPSPPPPFPHTPPSSHCLSVPSFPAYTINQ